MPGRLAREHFRQVWLSPQPTQQHGVPQLPHARPGITQTSLPLAAQVGQRTPGSYMRKPSDDFWVLARVVVQCRTAVWYLPAWTEQARRGVLVRPVRPVRQGWEAGPGGKAWRRRQRCQGHGGLLAEPYCQILCAVVCVMVSSL
jgi:hypothetical protein